MQNIEQMDFSTRNHKQPVMKLQTLKENADKAVRVEFKVHHAPIYITALHNGEVATYQSPQMYPSTKDDDVLLSHYENLESASQLLENAHKHETVNISNTPFNKNNNNYTIKPSYGVLIQKTAMGKQIDQIILELQNGEFTVYTPELDSYIFPHPSKVLSKLSQKQHTRVLRSQYSIPRNIIQSSPEQTSKK